jgi:hypothetical protein
MERARRSVWWSLSLLLACVPLALWFAYHRARTGYTFGNPEYFRYNVESTLNLARILEAMGGPSLARHLSHEPLGADARRARRDVPEAAARRRRTSADASDVAVQLVFARAHPRARRRALGRGRRGARALHAARAAARHTRLGLDALAARARVAARRRARLRGVRYRCEVNPSYNFPWEENLAYRDFVLLHRDAARFLEENYPEARVLTSWPATDELRNPYYGYTSRPLKVVPVENFLREELERAAARKPEYDVALLYSTHGGLELEEAARLLGGARRLPRRAERPVGRRR